MKILASYLENEEIQYYTLHQDRAIGRAIMNISIRTPRSLWCSDYSMPRMGFSPLTPEGIEPTKEYLTGVIPFFNPNNGEDTSREGQGNGSLLLAKMTSDAKSAGAKMLATIQVTNDKIRTFLEKNGFMHLPRSQTYIKKI